MTRTAIVIVVLAWICAAQGGGLPEAVEKKQSTKAVEPPTIEAAVEMAIEAAKKAALPLIDSKFHEKGKRLAVPGDFRTIQAAIDAANPGDVVVVSAGTYFEQLVMKDGVKLVSDPSDGGDRLVTVEGARLKLPARTLRTIVDGSHGKPSRHGMVDFNPGVGRNTIVDGLTFRNLPKQDHHVPGHAHGLNVRGASPVIMNCYLLKCGSTGIGNHVVYKDQGAPMEKRDFRWANVAHKAEAVIYHNVIAGNFGLGIGCNHFSAPYVLGNEVFGNDDSELGGKPSPGMGAKHGAAPRLIGNIVHDNPGGGISSRVGVEQGAHPIDRRTRPTVVANVVYSNGTFRPGISNANGGTVDEPVRFLGNFVFEAGAVGIGLSDGAIGVVEGNLVSGSRAAGIAIFRATALRLNDNRVKGASGPGYMIAGGSRVKEMKGNAADGNRGPRFVVRGSTIG